MVALTKQYKLMLHAHSDADAVTRISQQDPEVGWSRTWLADLPPALAERIGWRNTDALFGNWQPATVDGTK